MRLNPLALDTFFYVCKRGNTLDFFRHFATFFRKDVCAILKLSYPRTLLSNLSKILDICCEPSCLIVEVCGKTFVDFEYTLGTW